MSLFARAWKSIIRQPIKSLVLLVTVAVLGTLIAGAVSLKQGILATQTEMENKMKLTGTIQIKEDIMKNIKSIEEYQAIPAVDTALLEKIAALPQVQGYELARQMSLSSYTMISKRIGTGSSRALSLNTIGAKNGALLDYAVGYITLVSGRWLTPEDENSQIKPVVIPDDFARDNNLAIGSSFTLDIRVTDGSKVQAAQSTGSYGDAQTKVGEATFSVVGIFHKEDRYILWNGALFSPDKQFPSLSMYTSGNTLGEIVKFAEEKSQEINGGANRYANYTVNPDLRLWLKDRQSADSFAAAAAEVGLPDQYEVVLSTEAYDKTLAPLQNLQWIVNWIIVATVAATIAVLSLVIALLLKSRRLEMGILFSLGERKKRIIQQIVAEILIVTVLGLTISAFAGFELSKGISGQMVKNEVETMVSGIATDDYNYDADVLHSLTEGTTPELGADTFVWIYLVGLLTAGAAAVLPVVFTLRQNPKNILMKGE